MSDTAARLDILIDIQSKLSELLKVQQGVRETKQEADKLSTILRQGLGIGTGMAIATQAIAGFKAAIVGTVREAIALAGVLKDQAENLQLSTDAYQVLLKAMRAAGGGMEHLNQLIAQNNRSLAEARNRTTGAANAYRVLGLDPAQLEGQTVERRLEAIGRAILRAKDSTAAYGAASQIVGSRNLPTLLGMLRSLATEGYDKLADSAKKAGQVMENDTIKRLDAAEKQIEAFKRKMTIATGEGLAAASMVGTSFKQDFWGTAWAMLSAGSNPLSMNGNLAGKVAMNQPALGASDVIKPTAGPSNPNDPLDVAHLAVMRAQLNRQLMESDPLMGKEDERRQKIIAGIRAEIYARSDLLDVLRATSNELTGDTNASREEKIIQLEAQIKELEHRATELGMNSSRYGDARLAYANVNDRSHFQGLKQGIEGGVFQWASQLGSAGDQAATAIEGTLGSAVSSISDELYNWVTTTESFGDMVKNLGPSFARSMLQAFIQMVAQYAVSKAAMFAIDVAFAAKSLALSVASAAKSLIAWIPAAIAAAISSYGIAAIIGTAAVIAAVGTMAARDSGGEVEPGRPYIVGEHRQEVFVPRTGGRIVPSVEQYLRTQPGFGAGGEVATASKPRLMLFRADTDAEFDAMRRSPLWDVHVVDSVMRRRGEILNG